MDFKEFIDKAQRDMAFDFYKLRDQLRSSRKGPQGEITELARALAMGEIPAEPGKASKLLKAHEKVSGEHEETLALLFAQARFVKKILWHLQEEGFLHCHGTY